MLLTDVHPYDSDFLHMSISTKTYWWHQLLSNGGNLFVHLIKVYFIRDFENGLFHFNLQAIQ